MLVKAGLAAAVAIVAAVPLSRVDYRAMYNGMYPVSGLKRDVLGLCNEARPTFVRALRSERVSCYDSMPDTIDLAIGWVRTSERIAALKRRPTAIDRAERLLVEAVMRQRIGLLGPPRFTGYITRPVAGLLPCPQAAGAAPPAGTSELIVAQSDVWLAPRIAAGAEPALSLIGIMPANAAAKEDLPPLPLSGGEAADPARHGYAAAALLDGHRAAGLGDSSPLPAAPPPAGCRAPV